MTQPRRQRREGRDHAPEDIFFVAVDGCQPLQAAGFPRGAHVGLSPFDGDLREGRAYVMHDGADVWVAKCMIGAGGLYVGGKGRPPASTTKILSRVVQVVVDHAPTLQGIDRERVLQIR